MKSDRIVTAENIMKKPQNESKSDDAETEVRHHYFFCSGASLNTNNSWRRNISHDHPYVQYSTVPYRYQGTGVPVRRTVFFVLPVLSGLCVITVGRPIICMGKMTVFCEQKKMHIDLDEVRGRNLISRTTTRIDGENISKSIWVQYTRISVY